MLKGEDRTRVKVLRGVVGVSGDIFGVVWVLGVEGWSGIST